MHSLVSQRITHMAKSLIYISFSSMDVIISGFCGTRTRRGTEAKQWKPRTVLRKEKIVEQETRRNLKCNKCKCLEDWLLKMELTWSKEQSRSSRHLAQRPSRHLFVKCQQIYLCKIWSGVKSSRKTPFCGRTLLILDHSDCTHNCCRKLWVFWLLSNTAIKEVPQSACCLRGGVKSYLDNCRWTRLVL